MAVIAARPAPSHSSGAARYVLRTWQVLLVIAALLALLFRRAMRVMYR